MGRHTRALAVLVLALGVLPACSLARSVTSASDASMPPMEDAHGALDLGPRVDAWSSDDAWSSSDAWSAVDMAQPPNDAWTPPPDDAWTPPDDAWSPGADTGVNPCTASYGMLTGYQFCSSTGIACAFYATLTGNCGDVCGARCMSQTDAPNAADRCMAGTAHSCTHNHTDSICICAP